MKPTYAELARELIQQYLDMQEFDAAVQEGRYAAIRFVFSRMIDRLETILGRAEQSENEKGDP